MVLRKPKGRWCRANGTYRNTGAASMAYRVRVTRSGREPIRRVSVSAVASDRRLLEQQRIGLITRLLLDRNRCRARFAGGLTAFGLFGAFFYQGVEDGNENQSNQRRSGEPPQDDASHGGLNLAALTKPQSHRNQTENGRERRHQNRSQASTPTQFHGLAKSQSLIPAQLIDAVYQHDGIVDDDAG